MNKIIAPTKIELAHSKEWREGSGVSKSITELNLKSISHEQEIAKLLNWNAYLGTPGWYVNSVELQTGNLRRFGQFKPDEAIHFPNQAKAQKYISFPKGDGTEVILLLPDMATWYEIAERYQVPIAPSDIAKSRLDRGFWKWVADNPQLPLEVTEGVKKAGCLLANGYISICLTGVWNSKQKKKLKAIPTLAPFLAQGRPIHLVFDSDIVVKQQVQEALKYAGYLAVKAGCVVGVATWSYTESTKGVDDLIVNQGIKAFETVMDNLIPFKEWLKSLEQQFKENKGLIRLDTGALIKYVRTKYRDRLRLNLLQQKIELDGEQMLTESAYLKLAEQERIDCSKTKAGDIFAHVAEENAYNPVVNYLNTVAQQIKPIEIDNLSVRYFGTKNPLYDLFLKKTLIAAVARVYEPGCKHDTTLVLQGEQGVGKSSFFNVLGGEWFDDSMGDGRDKDDLIILHKSWIQEWGEIERVFSKRQAGELKAFITRKKDIFRPPYGRTALEFPRHSIIVGSVNDHQFLVDSTGNRRYWVVPIGVKEINLAQLKQERDGIWAAAVKAYRHGEQWWLSNDEENLSAENNSKFQIIDEWQSAIAFYLEHREQVSITELLLQVFDFELGKIERRDQMRVANILTNLKWKKVGQKQHQGKRQIVWIPTPPLKPIDVEEVLQSEIQPQSALSTPTIPSTHNTESKNKSFDSQVQQSEKKVVNTKVEVLQTVLKPIFGQTKISPTDREIKSLASVDWQSYPYSSQDIYTLKNRAKKVRERLISCSTYGELINLYAEGKVSEVEVKWLKSNLLSPSEGNNLSQVEATIQTDIFNQNEHQQVTDFLPSTYSALKEETSKEIRRIGWSKKQGIRYIKEKYGVSNRAQMSLEQLIEFKGYLRSLPNK
jgi:predicted P-loop ATPase